LQKLLEFEGDVESAFEQCFQITYDVFGEIRVHDLKPGGDKIPLTNENRKGAEKPCLLVSAAFLKPLFF